MNPANFFEKCVCPSDKWEPVLSNGGEVLGQQCKLCLSIVRWFGSCQQCGKRSDRLIRYQGGVAYCSEDCHRAHLEAKRAAKEARGKARNASAPKTPKAPPQESIRVAK